MVEVLTKVISGESIGIRLELSMADSKASQSTFAHGT